MLFSYLWVLPLIFIVYCIVRLVLVNVSGTIPGPKVLFPFVGNVPEELLLDSGLGKHHVYLLRNTIKYGGIYRYYTFMLNYIIGSPEGAKYVLQTDWQKFDREPSLQAVFNRIAGGLVLQSNGHQWKKDRDLFEQAFKANQLNELHGVMQEKISKAMQRLEQCCISGESIDIQKLFSSITFDIIGVFTLGHDFNTISDPDARMCTAWANSLSFLMYTYFIPAYWKLYKTEFIRKGEADLKFLEDTFDEVINSKKDIKEGDYSLLSFMLRENQRSPGAYNLKQIRTHMTTFLFAGHDTTANALTWLFYYLALHPDEDAKTWDEIKTIVGDRNVTIDDLPSLQYLNCVVKETLRLKPSAPILGRYLIEDDEFMGHKLKGKTGVAWGPYLIHLNPNIWEDPESFKPHRFLAENAKGMHPYTYVPFGGGPRRCIGEQLALREIKVAAVSIMQRYKMTLVPGHPIEEVMRVTMFAKHGLLMYISKRN